MFIIIIITYTLLFLADGSNCHCSEQKLLLPSGLELMSESPALSLSSAARHIDFHSLRRIYVAFSASHSAFTTPRCPRSYEPGFVS